VTSTKLTNNAFLFSRPPDELWNFCSHVLSLLEAKVPYVELSLTGTFAPESENEAELSFPQHELSVIYTDFEKACNKVPHNRLISKLWSGTC